MTDSEIAKRNERLSSAYWEWKNGIKPAQDVLKMYEEEMEKERLGWIKMVRNAKKYFS